jgi:hypothetical protein
MFVINETTIVVVVATVPANIKFAFSAAQKLFRFIVVTATVNALFNLLLCDAFFIELIHMAFVALVDFNLMATLHHILACH